MKSLLAVINQTWDKWFVIFWSLYVLLPTSPLKLQLANRDSGVFLYMGWRILNGEFPYQDVWDHKPPVIYVINALGLAMTNGSRWGVWLLEVISLSLAAYFGFVIIRKVFGSASAVFSTLLWLFTFVFVMEGGNFTTEYTLPLQFAALWLVKSAMDKTGASLRHWFLIGLLGGITFFTKQTAVGIWISVILFLAVYRTRSRQVKQLIFESISFVSGALAVCIVWVVIFGLQGGLAEFWDAVFRYNFVYSSQLPGLLARLVPIVLGIAPLNAVGLFQFAGIGILLGLLLILFKRAVIRSWFSLLAIGLIDFPIELILISVSGRTYAHYYMTLLPVLAFFAGLAFWVILSSRFFSEISRIASRVLTVGVVVVILWASFHQYQKTTLFFEEVNKQAIIVREIQSSTNPEDTVLLWGAEASINYFSQRVSPTRFIYQYPLYAQGYTNEPMIIEFLDDIIQMRPLLLIDTHNPETPLYAFPIQTDAIRERIRYLQCHYQAGSELQYLNWTVYEYVERDCPP